ncbi:MAG TPA: hypothetical protein VF469_30860 [Kofleriaceae bacterium]
MRSSLIACAPLALAAACSPDPPPQLLDGSIIDADPQAVCLIPAGYGALGTKTGSPDVTTGNTLTVVLDPGPPKDDFFVKLVAGKGAFAGGALKTGAFDLTGADASFTSCGLCINVIADIVAGQGPTKFYYADAGTVTLTSADATGASPSKIAGSAQNLHFVETNLDGTPVPGGCTATIASIAFGP